MSLKVASENELTIRSVDEWADFIDAELVRLKSWLDQKKGTALLVGDKIDAILNDVALFKKLAVKFSVEKNQEVSRLIDQLLASLSVAAYRRSGQDCVMLLIQLHYLIERL